MNKSNKELHDAQNRAQRAKDFKVNPEGLEFADKELDDLRKGKLGDDLHAYGKVERESHLYNSAYKTKQELEEYEVQYDPNNDFAIFGIGD
jgi:hypothetical protein